MAEGDSAGEEVFTTTTTTITPGGTSTAIITAMTMATTEDGQGAGTTGEYKSATAKRLSGPGIVGGRGGGGKIMIILLSLTINHHISCPMQTL